MKKFSKKGILLFAGAMAICAFVLPAAASAATWSPAGSEHSLDSAGIGFTSPASGGIVSNCTVAQFTTTVAANGSTATITTGFFRACTSSGPVIGDCTTTSVPTNFPWHIDPVNATTVALTGLRVDVRFENMPGAAGCAANGATTLLTGTVHAAWSNATHVATFDNAEGVVSHAGGVATPVTVRGTFRDTQQTLVVS